MKLNPTKIMKIKRNGFARVLLASFLCLAMLLSPLSMRAAYAAENDAGEELDPLRIGSFSVTFEFYNETTGNKEPVTGGNSVGLFKVADVVYVDQVGWRFKADSRFAEIGDRLRAKSRRTQEFGARRVDVRVLRLRLDV